MESHQSVQFAAPKGWFVKQWLFGERPSARIIHLRHLTSYLSVLWKLHKTAPRTCPATLSVWIASIFPSSSRITTGWAPLFEEVLFSISTCLSPAASQGPLRRGLGESGCLQSLPVLPFNSWSRTIQMSFGPETPCATFAHTSCISITVEAHRHWRRERAERAVNLRHEQRVVRVL